jgi:hypothetical protein
MTAKSRRRKINKKLRSISDVSTQPRNSRPDHEREEGRPSAIELREGRLVGVSFVRRGEGYGYLIEDNGGTEEALRATGALDSAALAERGTPEAAGQSPSEQDAAAEAHFAFFEAEVEGQVTDIQTEECFCSELTHHWKVLGEN